LYSIGYILLFVPSLYALIIIHIPTLTFHGTSSICSRSVCVFVWPLHNYVIYNHGLVPGLFHITIELPRNMFLSSYVVRAVPCVSLFLLVFVQRQQRCRCLRFQVDVVGASSDSRCLYIIDLGVTWVWPSGGVKRDFSPAIFPVMSSAMAGHSFI
jgi:hypothetical protein